VKRTSAFDLLAVFAVVTIGVYLLLRSFYDSIPPVHYQVALPIAGLAIGELIVARRVRLAVTHDPDAKLMAAIVIARCVALGKASALVAAATLGAAAGLLIEVIPNASTVTAAANDFRAGLAILGASVLLLVAGLLLERSGLIPRDPGATQVHR
jgi:uncharacterized protein YqgC (DUF456 family)